MQGDLTPVSDGVCQDSSTSESEVIDVPSADAASKETQPDESDGAPRRSLWEWLWVLITGSEPVADRLAALDAAIDAEPDAPANYMLRAELYAQLGEDALALADFERAQMLAADRYTRDNWGLVSQAVRDRAAAGAVQSARRLARLRREPDTNEDND